MGTWSARLPVYAARLRMPLLWGALVLLVGGALLGGPGWAGLGGLVLPVAGLSLYFRVGTMRRPPVEVAAPVAGRWTAVNSPADKVPSHGLHAYAVLAHLRRGSLRVASGQPVHAGAQVAECGNSGNSTEPHLHFQLMDHRSVPFAAGVPANEQPFTVAAPS
jgi:Peptidase family M23